MTVQPRTSLGLTIGAAIGKGAAYTVHGAVRAAQATGSFGADLATGATEGYISKAAELAAYREAMRAQAVQAEAIRVASKVEPAMPVVPAARRARARA